MSEPRVRTITTAEGMFINVEDLKMVITDTEWMRKEIVPLLKVGSDLGHPPEVIIAVVVGSVITTCAGLYDEIHREYQQRRAGQN